MAGTTNNGGRDEDARIERVKSAKACGGSLFRLPWGLQTDTLLSNFGLGQNVTIDWKRRTLIMEDTKTGRRSYVPFERLDFAEVLNDDEYKAQMTAVGK